MKSGSLRGSKYDGSVFFRPGSDHETMSLSEIGATCFSGQVPPEHTEYCVVFTVKDLQQVASLHDDPHGRSHRIAKPLAPGGARHIKFFGLGPQGASDNPPLFAGKTNEFLGITFFLVLLVV